MDRVGQLRHRQFVRESILSCRRCQLHTVCRAPVPFDGPSPARLAVVGEAPGRNEDIQGRPFVGVSGQLLKNKLTIAGFRVDDIAFINTVNCFPNRTPTPREVAACRINLLKQLEVVKPEFALVVGGVAVGAWWPGLPMGRARSRWWCTEIGDHETWVMATWHPAAVLRNPRLHLDFNVDLVRFKQASDWIAGKGPVLHDTCMRCGRKPVPHESIVVSESVWCREHDPRPAPPKKAKKRKRFQETQAQLLS